MVAELYPHIVNAVYDRPWAIRESMLVTITDILEARIRGERLSDEDVAIRLQGKGPARRLGYMAGDVAVIPVYGTIFPKADAFNDMSGGTSLSSLTDAIYEANNDRHVKAMVLDVDSPGGMADGLPEFTADLQGMGRNKPLIAVANHMAASAAYWIASQADEVITTPSATTGSIGVFAAHRDISGMEEKRGVKTTLVSAGKYKTELSPYEPLSESGLEHVQGLVDYTYEQFTEAVAAGRHTTPEAVRSGYGEGRVLSARAAMQAGLVDGIATLNDTISRAQSGDVAAPAGTVSIVVPSDIALSAPSPNVEAGPIPPHGSATVDRPWDGARNKANLRNDGGSAYFRRAFAWVDSSADQDTKSSYKFIHHEVSSGGDIGAANTNGCLAGIQVLNGARLGTTIPAADRRGVYNHLANHMRAAGREPPPLKSEATTYTERMESSLREVSELVADAGRFASLTEVKREQFLSLKQKLEDLLAEPGEPVAPAAVAMTEDAEHLFTMVGLRINDDEEE